MEKWKVALRGAREKGLRQVAVGRVTTMVMMLRRFDTAPRIGVGIGGLVDRLGRCVRMAAIVVVTMIQNRMTYLGLSDAVGGVGRVLKHRRVIHGEVYLRADAQPEHKKVAYEKATQFHAQSIYWPSVSWQGVFKFRETRP